MINFIQYILMVVITFCAVGMVHADEYNSLQKTRMDHVEFRINQYLLQNGLDVEDKSIKPSDTPAVILPPRKQQGSVRPYKRVARVHSKRSTVLE